MPVTGAVALLVSVACGNRGAREEPPEQAAAEWTAPPPSVHGVWEGEIDTPRRPLVLLANLDSATARLSATGGTIFPLQGLSLQGDTVSFALPLGSDTISINGVKDSSGLTGVARIGGRAHRFALSRLPDRTPPASRAEAWRQDLDIVLQRFLPYDRSFTPATRAAFAARIEQLKDSASLFSDDRMKVELARAVALSDNAHTRLYLVRNRTEVRRMPIRVWPFSDGHYVVRAAPEQRDLLGCRIERIGGVDIATAAERVRGVKAGNTQWQRYMSAYMLTSAEILSGTGIASSAERIQYDFTCGGRPSSRELVPLPLQPSPSTVEAWWGLSPASERGEATPLSALPRDRVPLYLRHPDRNYWFEFVIGSDLVYVQYNRAQNMRDESLADFQARLLDSLRRHSVGALALDLRFNTGGNMDIAAQLMSSLRQRFSRGRVFVITGPATFSAGLSHAAQWKAWGATIVGEPVGDELDAWGEGGNIVLPHSGLTLHYANGFHAYSRRPYPEIPSKYADLNVATLGPDVPTSLVWRQYIGGRDPAMDAVLTAASRRGRRR